MREECTDAEETGFRRTDSVCAEAGAVGAALSPKIILILGVANLLADGFSMAAANYSGSKSEADDYAQLIAIEEKHIAVTPDGEKEEIRRIFRSKGYQGARLLSPIL